MNHYVIYVISKNNEEIDEVFSTENPSDVLMEWLENNHYEVDSVDGDESGAFFTFIDGDMFSII